MDYKIEVSPIARNNIKESVAYYKANASVKVAKNFVENYLKTVEKIKRNPFYKVYYKNFRGLMLKKYPFIIFYQVDEIEKIIYIKAVFHTSQKPEKYP